MSLINLTNIDKVVYIVVPGGIGSLLVLAASALTWSNLHRLTKWPRAAGRVCALKEELHERNRRCFRPEVRFMTMDGYEVTFESKIATSNRGYVVGDFVEVLYDPQNAKNAEIISFVRLWLLVFFLTLCAGVFFAIAYSHFISV